MLLFISNFDLTEIDMRFFNTSKESECIDPISKKLYDYWKNIKFTICRFINEELGYIFKYHIRSRHTLIFITYSLAHSLYVDCIKCTYRSVYKLLQLNTIDSENVLNKGNISSNQ